MEIIEYLDIYEEDVKDLLVELQEYIVSIDKEGYNIITSEYRDKYFKKTIDEVYKNNGKIYLAKEENKILGIIIGIINNEETDSYDFRCPKRGRIMEFIVSKKCRGKGIGSALLDKIENYFKNLDCKAILLDAFSYNENAKVIYESKGYKDRLEEMIKII